MDGGDAVGEEQRELVRRSYGDHAEIVLRSYGGRTEIVRRPCALDGGDAVGEQQRELVPAEEQRDVAAALRHVLRRQEQASAVRKCEMV